MKNRCYLNCKKVDTAIGRAKRILADFAKKNGLCENFGTDMAREMENKFVDICDFSSEMNSVRRKIDRFRDWCMIYTG